MDLLYFPEGISDSVTYEMYWYGGKAKAPFLTEEVGFCLVCNRRCTILTEAGSGLMLSLQEGG